MAINEALAEYLALYHKGEVNAVTSRELECSFQMRGSELRREINALRGDGIPICSFEGGYSQMGHRQGNQADLCPCALQSQRVAQRTESPHGAGIDPRLQGATAGTHRTGRQR